MGGILEDVCVYLYKSMYMSLRRKDTIVWVGKHTAGVRFHWFMAWFLLVGSHGHLVRLHVCMCIFFLNIHSCFWSTHSGWNMWQVLSFPPEAEIKYTSSSNYRKGQKNEQPNDASRKYFLHFLFCKYIQWNNL